MKVILRKHYRSGAVGALMDEYERAAEEFERLVALISEADYVRIVDEQTADEDCRSVLTIASHVVRAGYGYADYIRASFNVASDVFALRLFSAREFSAELDKMLAYTVQTLEGKWQMSYEEMISVVITTRRGGVYHLEQMLQHAIVHIMRHRRQIEKFIAGGLIALPEESSELI